LIKLDLQSRTPIYEQLKQKICELAAIGQLRPNDQLPSVRSFARELGINPNTVQKAYQELEREGIIYSVTGKGSFLSTKLDLDAQLHQQYLQKIAQATSLAKQCGIPLQLVLETVRKVYEEDQNE
jgi:GntR family transcriptional regulator